MNLGARYKIGLELFPGYIFLGSLFLKNIWFSTLSQGLSIQHSSLNDLPYNVHVHLPDDSCRTVSHFYVIYGYAGPKFSPDFLLRRTLEITSELLFQWHSSVMESTNCFLLFVIWLIICCPRCNTIESFLFFRVLFIWPRKFSFIWTAQLRECLSQGRPI